jgi:lysozyme
MTETLTDRIKRHEGFRARVYPDSLGKMTIGYGRCLTTEGISEDEAYMLLDNDITHLKQDLPNSFPWWSALDPIRQDVITEMCFQLGIQGVAKFPSMIAAIKLGDYVAAAREMQNSAWHIQTPDRCEELAQIMETGI